MCPRGRRFAARAFSQRKNHFSLERCYIKAPPNCPGEEVMKRLVVVLCFFALFSGAALAAPAKDIEAAFAKAQAAFAENRLDEAAEEFTSVAEALAAAKQADKARAIYGNVAVIRIKQERWQDALGVYVKIEALPGKPAPEALLKMTRNIVVCAENLHLPVLKAQSIARLLAAKVTLTPEDALNFLAMQGDAYRAAEMYGLACRAYEKALSLKNVPAETRLALLTGLGLAQGNLGRYTQALKSLEAARQEAETLKEPLPLVESTSNMGILYWEMGQYDKAASALQQAMDYAREFSLRRNEGVDSNNMGLVYKNAGRLPEAVDCIDTALAIAREVKNRRDEAIALANRALLARLNGKNDAARKDYNDALVIYKEVGFKEGEASTLLGLGHLDMLISKDYPAAEDKFTRAASIYAELGNPGFLAESYVQLGLLYQKNATPKRKTRDLVFDDTEPELVTMSPQEALDKSAEYFGQALPLAEKTGRKEMVWSALHGLAFAARQKGDLAKAEDLYAKAVDVVLSMKGAEENPDLLVGFLRDKDDLFAEAMDVCARLYRETNNPALLMKQMQYDEIYRNEVMKANMKMAAMEYQDPAKQALYAEVMSLAASKEKSAQAAADAALAVESAEAAGDAKDEAAQAAVQEAAKAETAIAAQDASTVAKEFEAKLALWKERYPQDMVLFESMATVDTAKLQAGLGPEQAIVQYLPLEDFLVILTITKEEVAMTNVDVKYETLASLIRDELLAENIEKFGHGNMGEREGFAQALGILKDLTGYLYSPIAERLKSKEHLYVITSKYLSYMPFAALVIGEKSDGAPQFLVEEKIITLTRLSFLQQALLKPQTTVPGKDAIVVGDPQHTALEVVLGRLDSAMKEAENVSRVVSKNDSGAMATLLTAEQATKSAWKEAVGKNSYSIMHFATHGVPFAEMKSDYGRITDAVSKAEVKGKTDIKGVDIKLYKDFIEFYNASFSNNSHLNGFLFFAYPDDQENGMLTLKEILELPDSVFAKADLAILSACNTAVSYSPKVLQNEAIRAELEDSLATAEMIASGWVPGVDQVCLVDTFFKRNFRNVYGTLWFADDVASGVIMSDFMDNLKTLPPAEALRAAQLAYLHAPPQRPADNDTDYPLHPFFWACGNIFGQ